MFKKIKKILKNFLISILYRDKNIFYDPFFGSVDIKHLFFWNIIKPQRTLVRIKYKRFLLPKKINENDSNIYVDTNELSDKQIAKDASEKLNKHGVVLLQNYFKEETLQDFENKYKDFFDQVLINGAEKERSSSEVLTFTDQLSKLWFDEKIIDIIQNYIKRLPYARNYPVIVSKKPKDLNPVKGILADDWHLDHATLIQAAIYFDDVVENGSHMEVLRGTHRFPNVAAAGMLSKEYVLKKKLPIAKCIGKKGTVQIHCGNVFHRLKVSPNSRRTWLKFEFSSGNNILLNSQKIADMLSNKFDLNTLDIKSKKILSSIFPAFLNKGYEIKNNTLSPTKYKNI